MDGFALYVVKRGAAIAIVALLNSEAVHKMGGIP